MPASRKKQKTIIANWKMNPLSLKEANEIVFKLVSLPKNISVKSKIIICPPFVWLNDLIRINKDIDFGSQNCSWENKGAYTGEISPVMLKNAGCKYVILGHSERKKYFNEGYDLVNKKIQGALEAGLKVILCIGESEKNPDAKYDEILAQITAAFDKISKNDINKILLVYEPAWAVSAVSKGESDTPANAESSAILIKKFMVKLYNHDILDKIKVLYGGSVNSKNSQEFLKENDIDGLLVGAASLDADEFIKIIS